MQETINVLFSLFQISVATIPKKNLSQYISLPFQDYNQFIEFCSQNNMEDKAKLVDITMENLNFWDLNSRLGDMKLMVLTS